MPDRDSSALQRLNIIHILPINTCKITFTARNLEATEAHVSELKPLDVEFLYRPYENCRL